MTQITKAEYYRLKAENVELKLEKVEREHKREMAQMEVVLNEFLSLMGENEMIFILHAFNLRVTLNRVLEKQHRGTIPVAILEDDTL